MKLDVCKDNQTLFTCDTLECIPLNRQLKLMNQSGYYFKLDGKKITLKKLEEWLKQNKEKE